MYKLQQKDFITRSRIKHNNKYDYSKTIYVNYRTLLTITCPTHGDFKQKPKGHLWAGYGCPKCGVVRTHSVSSRLQPNSDERIGFDRFKTLADKVHNNKYEYKNYTLYSSYFDVICPVHGVSSQKPVVHLNSSGCKQCTIDQRRMTNEQFIDRAKSVHGDIYNYAKTNYTHYGCTVTITCKQHGDFNTVGSEHIRKRGSGCPMCNESKGERKVRLFLIKNKIEYKTEYKLCKGKAPRFDFYLPKLNIFIEYDGVQHYKAVDIFGGLESFHKIRNRDKLKNELAKTYSIPLIRIPYTSYKNLEDFLFKKITTIYKYRVGNKFYRTFLLLCKGENLPGETRPKDVIQYLLVNRPVMQ